MDATNLKAHSCAGPSRAIITRIELPETTAHRLRAMGAFEGQQVDVERSTRSVLLTVMGTRIAIANDAAEKIHVIADVAVGNE